MSKRSAALLVAFIFMVGLASTLAAFLSHDFGYPWWTGAILPFGILFIALAVGWIKNERHKIRTRNSYPPRRRR